jgi:hypothetical protein
MDIGPNRTEKEPLTPDWSSESKVDWLNLLEFMVKGNSEREED